MTLLRAISAAVLALTICVGIRADEGCKACEEKARCSECDNAKRTVCDTAKRCSGSVKDVFVHKISGNIVRGFGFGKCDTCEKPKPDCGCK